MRGRGRASSLERTVALDVHRLTTAEYERMVDSGALADLNVELRGDDVLDACVDGVPTSTVAELLRGTR
jgi:hypothetical protein